MSPSISLMQPFIPLSLLKEICLIEIPKTGISFMIYTSTMVEENFGIHQRETCQIDINCPIRSCTMIKENFGTCFRETLHTVIDFNICPFTIVEENFGIRCGTTPQTDIDFFIYSTMIEETFGARQRETLLICINSAFYSFTMVEEIKGILLMKRLRLTLVLSFIPSIQHD